MQEKNVISRKDKIVLRDCIDSEAVLGIKDRELTKKSISYVLQGVVKPFFVKEKETLEEKGDVGEKEH